MSVLNRIKIIHTHLETPLIVSPENVQILIIENPKEFYECVNELSAQMEGGEGNFIFMEGDKQISSESAGEMVSNFFAFELNDKKILNILYKKLERQAFERENTGLLDGVNREASHFLKGVFEEFPFALSFEELQPSDIFKAASVKFEKIYDSFLEKIICYINILVALKGCRFFIFVNLKSVLNDEELEALYLHCQNEKVGLLLVESWLARPLLKSEKAVIITEDLCEILENYD